MKRLRLQHIIAWILWVIMGLVVFHAPLTVFIESRWPFAGDGIKAWKELMLAVALILLVIDYYRRRTLATLRNDWVVWLVGVYALLHIATSLLSPVTQGQAIAGLMIDLRYVAYFIAISSLSTVIFQGFTNWLRYSFGVCGVTTRIAT